MKQLTAISVIWHQNKFFFYLLIALFTIGLFPFFLFDKTSFFILLKHWYHPVADCIAPYISWLGDGVLYLFLLFMAALFRASCRKLIIISGSFFCMSIVVQCLKRVFFSHMLRPIALLPSDVSVHLIDGVPLLTDLSFPSGHSATIFVLISLIQLLGRKKKNVYSVILIGLGLIVAYSRIYLCQHFYIDVYVGAWMGTVSTIVVYIFATHLNGPDWLDRSIYFFLYRYAKWLPIKK